MAHDSYNGKVYLALVIGDSLEGLTNVWETQVQEEVLWSFVREDWET